MNHQPWFLSITWTIFIIIYCYSSVSWEREAKPKEIISYQSSFSIQRLSRDISLNKILNHKEHWTAFFFFLVLTHQMTIMFIISIEMTLFILHCIYYSHVSFGFFYSFFFLHFFCCCQPGELNKNCFQLKEHEHNIYWIFEWFGSKHFTLAYLMSYDSCYNTPYAIKNLIQWIAVRKIESKNQMAYFLHDKSPYEFFNKFTWSIQWINNKIIFSTWFCAERKIKIKYQTIHILQEFN